MRFRVSSFIASLSLLIMSTTGCQRIQAISRSIIPVRSPRARGVYEREIQEYLRLFEAQARLPDLEAVRELRMIVIARPHSPAAYEAHVALARYYARIGDPEAEDEYRAALALEDTEGLRLELARWLEGQGKRADAYAEYRALLPRYPQAFEAMRRLGSDPLEVARDLNKASYYSDALEALHGVADPKADIVRACALNGLGRHGEAIHLFRLWLAQRPEDVEARMGLACALVGVGEVGEALPLYESIDSPDSLLTQAELWASQDPIRATSLYLECPYPVAKWKAAALLEKQGRITETLPLYAELAEGQTKWADDAAYRLYVLADRLGLSAQRERARQYLRASQPNFLALRVGESWSPDVTLPFRPAGTEILSKTAALESLGMEDLAYRELIMAAHFDTRPEARATYARALFEQGYLLEAQRVAEQTLYKLQEAPLPLWKLAYPRPYEPEVLAAAQEFDLDPLLLWAIMYTESRYDPEALSWAQAQGLMQLIPSTAAWAAESADIPFTPLDAYDIRTNIRLGAWYLHWLLDYFDGDLELAITAYNGGPGNVSIWNEQAETREDFLRWIGFDEAREYVNRVLTVYHIYQELEQWSPQKW